MTIASVSRGRRSAPSALTRVPLPVVAKNRDPATTLAEITAAARAHLPGAAVRWRLFFGYTLRWDKSPVTAPPPGSGNPATREPLDR